MKKVQILKISTLKITLPTEWKWHVFHFLNVAEQFCIPVYLKYSSDVNLSSEKKSRQKIIYNRIYVRKSEKSSNFENLNFENNPPNRLKMRCFSRETFFQMGSKIFLEVVEPCCKYLKDALNIRVASRKKIRGVMYVWKNILSKNRLGGKKPTFFPPLIPI